MLKIVGVGDPIIPQDTMEEIFRQQNRLKGEFIKCTWDVDDPGQLQRLRSIYEEKGPGAVPLPLHLLKEAADVHILVVHFTPVAEVEEVQKLGADAVSIGLLTGTSDQPSMFEHMGRISCQCEERGMPLIVHAYPKGEMIKDEERYNYEHISYSVRAAVECGADIVKTWYTGDYDSFARVVDASHGRVVVAGGAKMKDTESFFKVT